MYIEVSRFAWPQGAAIVDGETARQGLEVKRSGEQ
jgi:hypothetical protein